MHIADLTMFYAPESGGIKRYLNAKCNWLRLHPGYRHSLIVPAHPGLRPERGNRPAAQVRLKSFPLTSGYRLPYVPGAAGRAISALRQDVVEVADPFHLAWEAASACRRSSIPIVAFCHSDVPEAVRRLLGATAGSAAARYLRRIYDKFDLVLTPSAYMAERLCELGLRHVRVQALGVDTDIFRPAASDRHLRERLRIDSGARLLVFAGRLVGRAWAYAACGALSLACVLGIVFGNAFVILAAAAALGFSGAVTITLMLALPALLGAPADVPRMTAAMFTISYSWAVIVPVVSGYAWDASGWPAAAFIPIGLCNFLLIGLARAIPRAATAVG